MSDTITLTNPATGETWTSGKRGRKPKWVMELEAAGTVIPKKAPVAADKSTDAPIIPGALRVWRYVGQAGECGDNDDHQRRVRCLIIAASPIDAVKVGSSTFINPMMPAELSVMWREVEDPAAVANIHASGIDVTKPAVYESAAEGMRIRKSRLTSATH